LPLGDEFSEECRLLLGWHMYPHPIEVGRHGVLTSVR
jgi:hypothetical protein